LIAYDDGDLTADELCSKLFWVSQL